MRHGCIFVLLKDWRGLVVLGFFLCQFRLLEDELRRSGGVCECGRFSGWLFLRPEILFFVCFDWRVFPIFLGINILGLFWFVFLVDVLFRRKGNLEY